MSREPFRSLAREEDARGRAPSEDPVHDRPDPIPPLEWRVSDLP